MSGAPVATVYAIAPSVALATRRPVGLVETTERHEGDWLELSRRHAPEAAELLVTPRPVGSA